MYMPAKRLEVGCNARNMIWFPVLDGAFGTRVTGSGNGVGIMTIERRGLIGFDSRGLRHASIPAKRYSMCHINNIVVLYDLSPYVSTTVLGTSFIFGPSSKTSHEVWHLETGPPSVTAFQVHDFSSWLTSVQASNCWKTVIFACGGRASSPETPSRLFFRPLTCRGGL